jgi:hypothetical protein
MPASGGQAVVVLSVQWMAGHTLHTIAEVNTMCKTLVCLVWPQVLLLGQAELVVGDCSTYIPVYVQSANTRHILTVYLMLSGTATARRSWVLGTAAGCASSPA